MPIASRRRSRAGRILAALAGAILTLSVLTPVAGAAAPRVHLALSVSPSPSADGQEVVWTGTITPVGGTVATVSVHMEGLWYQYSGGSSMIVAMGICAPDPCTVSSQSGNAYWTLTGVTAKRTITYTTPARAGTPIRLYVDGGAGCADSSCPAAATIKVPTAAVSVAYSSSVYPVVPGATLHVTVTGTATAGPLEADLQALLGPGLDAPTAISPVTAVFSPPPSDYIDDGVTLNAGTPQTLTFDTVVTAALGANVTITGNIFPIGAAYASKALMIHVGPVKTTYQENNAKFRYAGVWSRLASAGASGGYIKQAAAKNASMTFTYRGLGVSVYATVGPTRGSARVYLDGVYQKTVSLYKKTAKARVIVFTSAMTVAPAAHTLKFVLVGTVRHPRVDVDAITVYN
jgi:hypothetical protein